MKDSHVRLSDACAERHTAARRAVYVWPQAADDLGWVRFVLAAGSSDRAVWTWSQREVRCLGLSGQARSNQAEEGGAWSIAGGDGGLQGGSHDGVDRCRQ